MLFTTNDGSNKYEQKLHNKPLAPLFFGEPSRRLFNPLNHNQVLFIISCYASVQQQFSQEDWSRLKNILTRVPKQLKSEKAVFNWVLTQAAVESENIPNEIVVSGAANDPVDK